MKEVLLIISILAVLAGGYFIMGGLDRFLAGSMRNEPPAYQKKKPASMLLTGSVSDEELIRTVRQFAGEHEQISIILRAEPGKDGATDQTGGNDA